MTRFRRRVFTALVVVGAATVTACGGDAAAGTGGTGGTGNDAITVETQPSPLQSGRRATVSVRVNDASGQPIAGAKVNVKAQHKTMSHGADADRLAEERDPGVYSINFLPSMAGSYRVTVSVDGPKGKSQATVDTEVR